MSGSITCRDCDFTTSSILEALKHAESERHQIRVPRGFTLPPGTATVEDLGPIVEAVEEAIRGPNPGGEATLPEVPPLLSLEDELYILAKMIEAVGDQADRVVRVNRSRAVAIVGLAAQLETLKTVMKDERRRVEQLHATAASRTGGVQ